MKKRLHCLSALAYNKHMKTPRKILSIILAAAAAACLIAACVLLIRNTLTDKHSEETLEALRVSAESIAASRETEAPETPSFEAGSHHTQAKETLPQEDPSSKEAASVTNPYRDSFLANEDMAAWLQIPGTKIDYPVMWTPEDENYYLYRDFEKHDSQSGSLILDTDSSLAPLTTNLIIHGHNMRSGAMFGNLTDYEDEEYCKEHSRITLYTEDCERNYEVIAAFRSQVFKKTEQVFKFYKFFQADTQEEFDDFYQNIKALSLYDTGVTAQFGDRFLTLSTCVYHVEQGRFVVVAKEVEGGDTYLPLTE